jgi:hypothetical protein
MEGELGKLKVGDLHHISPEADSSERLELRDNLKGVSGSKKSEISGILVAPPWHGVNPIEGGRLGRRIRAVKSDGCGKSGSFPSDSGHARSARSFKYRAITSAHAFSSVSNQVWVDSNRRVGAAGRL